MRVKKIKWVSILAVIALIAGVALFKIRQKEPNGETVKKIAPALGSIRTFISCTGTVLPKNRLEVKPPVSGRVESILVREGEKVRSGQALAWMSSTDRAALLDAARSQGDEKLKYWQDIYKPIALLAPIDAEVIVATVQPGQAVTTADAVVVLSDHLIVRAQVDETDIGKITEAMKAKITLDAYPNQIIKAKVEHIYYESQTVNNVTIYLVDLLPEEVSPFFRSGMNASVDFMTQEKEGILVLPVEAVNRENGDTYVLVQSGAKEPIKTRVELGITDDKNIEVVSGLNKSDSVIVKSKKFKLPTSSAGGTNPFMPRRH